MFSHNREEGERKCAQGPKKILAGRDFALALTGLLVINQTFNFLRDERKFEELALSSSAARCKFAGGLFREEGRGEGGEGGH